MSKIDKLSIQGIRAFSPSTAEAIQFNTPLTLIVGQNGSGKTTLIESLKYATTGQLPPNSKGGAFVHDPALTNDTVIPAQVKLAFYSTIGERMVVTRNLEVTAKKAGSRTFKTKDGSLKIVNGTERTTMSSKVAELDKTLPRHLGVSSAVLESVIFCHQDEALWPMSEPAALKKQFDLIFEAEKYTKAVDNLKKLKKDLATKVVALKKQEDFDKQTKERGRKCAKQIDTLQRQIEAAETEAHELEEELEEVQALIQQKREEANEFMGIVNKLENKQDLLVANKENVAELKASIDLLPGSDKRLEEDLAEYEEGLTRLEEQYRKKLQVFNRLQSELKSTRAKMGEKSTEQGQHQSDQDKYEKSVKLRVDMIQKAAGHHGIRGYDGDLSDKQVHAFSERIRKILGDQQRALNQLRKDNARDQDERQETIKELESQMSTHVHDRRAAKQTEDSNNKKAAALQDEVSRLAFDPSAQGVLEAELKAKEASHSKAFDEFSASNIDEQILNERQTSDQLESERARVNLELVECSRLSTDQAKLKLRQDALVDQERKLESLTSTWGGKLSAALGGSFDPENLESAFQRTIAQEKSEVEDAKSLQSKKNDELSKIEANLTTLRDRLKQATRDMKRYEATVISALRVTNDDDSDVELGMGHFKSRLAKFEDAVRGCHEDIALADAMKTYWEKTKKYLNHSDKCSMCDRHFSGQPQEKAKLEKKIQKNLSDEMKEETERALEEAATNLEQLKEVEQSFNKYHQTAEEVPSLQERIRSIEKDKALVVRALEEHDTTVKDAQDKLRDLEAMTKTVSTIDATHKDIKKSQDQIKDLETQQKSGGQLRSIDELQELQATCDAKIKASTEKMTKLNADKYRMTQIISSLDTAVRDLKHQIATVMGQSERNSNLLNQIKSLKEEAATKRADMKRFDAAMEALQPQIDEAKSAQALALTQGRTKEQNAAEEMSGIQDSVKDLERVERDIKDYLKSGGPDKLATIQQEIADLKKELASQEKESELVTAEANKIKNEVDNSDRTKRNIQDNLKYRKALTAVQTLEAEIRELTARHAVEDHASLLQEAKGLQDTYNTTNAKHGSILGAIKSKDDELARLDTEYKQEYADANKKYRETLIRHKTTNAAMADIDTYATALDKAVMAFHGRKMAEVNMIAGDLWHSTYQGSDIDTILIRSDSEGMTGRRNYNYRVCMVKQDTEMDMRGRCSAGQRVLASIIIRLALAESFGVNCGLIALDEPTTNLDAANIRSLATALNAIIKARQAQANFQLIIITHDEEFLREMQVGEFCDVFYRVGRSENQNSVIDRLSIRHLVDS